MPDLATQHDDGVFEPDEDTLINALRNQDDIPILMDVVTEQVSSSMSQEGHLAHSIDSPQEEVVGSTTFIDSGLPSQEFIAKTIANVLARRLPELVTEVVSLLHDAKANEED
ncbi:hypothetical protein [Marinomonas transparens]|uniref:Uncharacterized protein n=1 Tax=Marinomonas transparens TaxID=2795388 RepID=A0A934MZW2_9GAMM|nr:hypothetical protein [Marinomonas transparens]MBJ7537970.1 hypothetical protein [Marinomonas transparens]